MRLFTQSNTFLCKYYPPKEKNCYMCICEYIFKYVFVWKSILPIKCDLDTGKIFKYMHVYVNIYYPIDVCT